jgi:LmbE family N-acetylglucosaminyl deacetylase
MGFEQEQRAALRILEGIEEGNMTPAESLALVEDADPALVYLLFTWLRKRYANHENADAVIGRLVAISGRGSIAAKMKEGQADPVARWFEETYSYRKLEAPELVEIIVDKLES